LILDCLVFLKFLLPHLPLIPWPWLWQHILQTNSGPRTEQHAGVCVCVCVCVSVCVCVCVSVRRCV
jgi:hypothetical protein